MAPGIPSRRALLLGTTGAAVLAACGRERRPQTPGKSVMKVAYGAHARQYGVLAIPKHAKLLGTVVMVHGGGWLPDASLRAFEPMQVALTALGYATWNVEYRGVGVGGGFPGTLEDVAAGIDHLGNIAEGVSGIPNRILTSRIAFLGHSAGAQLAVWAASRSRKTPGGPPMVRPRATISMAGPLNLALGARHDLVGRIIPNFMGGMPSEVPERYAVADPIRLVPAPCVVWALSGDNDTVVPKEQALTYVSAARRAGGEAYLVNTQSDHLQMTTPAGQPWACIREILARTFRDG